MERPDERLIEVHADNVSAATGAELSNEACELARWIRVLEGRSDMAKAIIGLGDLSEAGWIAMLLDSLNGIPIVNELENAIRILHGERR